MLNGGVHGVFFFFTTYPAISMNGRLSRILTLDCSNGLFGVLNWLVMPQNSTRRDSLGLVEKKKLQSVFVSSSEKMSLFMLEIPILWYVLA